MIDLTTPILFCKLCIIVLLLAISSGCKKDSSNTQNLESIAEACDNSKLKLEISQLKNNIENFSKEKKHIHEPSKNTVNEKHYEAILSDIKSEILKLRQDIQTKHSSSHDNHENDENHDVHKLITPGEANILKSLQKLHQRVIALDHQKSPKVNKDNSKRIKNLILEKALKTLSQELSRQDSEAELLTNNDLVRITSLNEENTWDVKIKFKIDRQGKYDLAILKCQNQNNEITCSIVEIQALEE